MKRYKTLYIIIVCAVFLCAAWTPANAASGGRLVVEGGSAKAGETVDVDLRVTDNSGIVATLVSVRYDPSVLTLESAENGEVFADDCAVFGNDPSLMPYTMLWEDGLSTENHTETGVLATLHFTVKPDASSGDTEVTAEIGENSTFDTDLVRVPFAVENGTVRIGKTNGALNDQILLPAGILCAVFLIAAVAEIVRKKKTRKAGD